MCVCLRFLFGVAGLGLLVPAASAAPAYSTALSLRVQYDDNVFLQDPAPLAPGQTIPALPARAGAFGTTVGASLGLAWKTGPETLFESTYAPEIVRFSSYQTENHTNHRLSLSGNGTAGGWRYESKAGWLITAGSHESPVFNRLGGSPPIGSEPVRARRAQDVIKASGRISHPWHRGFVRGVLTVNRQDFHTAERSTTGYANYVDRGEWTAGADLGWELHSGFSLLAAVRQGGQQQADLLGVPLNYSNTLTRWLAGAEGRLGQTCKFSLLAGPDVRRFGPAVRPGFERHQTATYGEASATWTPTAADGFTLTGRHLLWLSSGGRGAYVDTLYAVNWKHHFTPDWILSTGFEQHTGYTGRYNPTAPRHDVVLAASCMLSHTFADKTRIDLGLALDGADSLIPATPGREYRRRIVSLGCSRLW